jgi:hypothetical protein
LINGMEILRVCGVGYQRVRCDQAGMRENRYALR